MPTLDLLCSSHFKSRPALNVTFNSSGIGNALAQAPKSSASAMATKEGLHAYRSYETSSLATKV
ncbi:hypothetical protein PPUJ13061_55650 [Pseudomonas putida]|nr:hypothetical protein PPUJ13061_55650 [Pseudomonas putida]